jgi:hypothetical protein
VDMVRTSSPFDLRRGMAETRTVATRFFKRL